jgi:uncharacterized protein DUF6599
MKSLAIPVILLMAAAGVSLAAERPAVLPTDFAGWHIEGTAKTSTDPGLADPAYASLLKEYGFTDLETANYRRDDGRTLAVKAARFESTSGAVGAYTFYRQAEMQKEQIGDWGSSFNQRILFFHGNVLIDAVFDRVTAMSAAELRQLAGLLPRPTGSTANMPPILAYMPSLGRIRNTEKYVMGPLALSQVSSPIPVPLVDFAAGAEVVLAKYYSAGGNATLMVINYPTPQIAAEHMRRIDATQGNTQQSPGVASIVDVGPFFDKRSGPLLVIASGPISQAEARSLLGSVNYDADVTWNEKTFFDKKNNLANLLVNIIILCAILIGLALVAGLAFGGLRIAIKRLLPDRIFDRPEEIEFISLHLEASPVPPSDSKLSSSIKAG